MKPLLVSLGIFVVGVIVLNACWRDYRERTARAMADDLHDLASGDGFGVVFWALITVVGFAMLVVTLAPGGVLEYSRRFPLLTFAEPAPSKP